MYVHLYAYMFVYVCVCVLVVLRSEVKLRLVLGISQDDGWVGRLLEIKFFYWSFPVQEVSRNSENDGSKKED